MKTAATFPAIRAVSTFADTLAALPVSRWLSVLSERRRLAALDNRLLDDIGIDIESRNAEVAKPFWEVTSRR